MGRSDTDSGTDEERAWDAYVRASDELSSARRRLFETDPLPLVRKELTGGPGLFAALNLLMDVGWNRPRLVRALVPELYASSLSLGRAGVFARLVLRRLARSGDPCTEGLHEEIGELMERTLREEGDDSLALRALGMLLEDIGATELIARFRQFGLASADADVRELITEDYPEDEFPAPRAPDA
ncbi:hypothetical protein [Streptomyces sp. NPDC058665]|uniref:hypothetical protein n=1 Tax=Streptomyces sp. NPDC058665 TaxID=3346586 RepID=UPI003664E069